MVQTVIMPKLGQTVEESTIVKWHKREGDAVAKGDILFEIETDKAVLEVESFFEGTLLKVLVPEGRTVPVTAPVGFIGQPGEPLPEVAPPPPPPPEPGPAAARLAPASAAAEPAPLPPAPAAPQPAPPRQAAPAVKAVSPRARRLIRECAVSAEPIPGSGPGGRVVEKDVRAYLDSHHYDALKITPAAKALARAEGIDLLALPQDVPGERITVEAVERAVAEKPKPMSKMRQVIAQRLTASFTGTPHFYVTVAADMTGLLALHKQWKAEKRPVSVTDFILKASALALVKFPALNSSTDGRMTRWHSRVHLGLAVSVPEGLVVPVIRGADTLSLPALHERARELAAKARAGKLTPDEMSGSTFTVSNMGMLDVDHFTAIINPGESAILAVASTRPTPVVRDGSVVIREMMNLTVSSDHRLVDGATAARFVNHIKQLLEDPDTWKRLI